MILTDQIGDDVPEKVILGRVTDVNDYFQKLSAEKELKKYCFVKENDPD